MVIELIYNSILVITLSAFMGIFIRIRKKRPILYPVLLGAWFGFIAISVMMIPFEYNGAYFDGRTIVLSMAGLFGGGIPALISAIISGIFRLYIGGPGIWAGLAQLLLALQ